LIESAFTSSAFKMKNETKEPWMAGVAAGLLILAGGFVFWHAEIFDKALSFPLRTPINYSGYLARSLASQR